MEFVEMELQTQTNGSRRREEIKRRIGIEKYIIEHTEQVSLICYDHVRRANSDK